MCFIVLLNFRSDALRQVLHAIMCILQSMQVRNRRLNNVPKVTEQGSGWSGVPLGSLEAEAHALNPRFSKLV